MPLIDIKELSFQYAGSTKHTLGPINLTIEPGDFILLIGPTGCGKSSLCRSLNGLIPHFYQGTMSGRVYVGGLDTREHEVHTLASTVGLVFQNPENQLVSLNVERELAFGPENLGLPRDEIQNRVEEVIALLKLESIRKKPPFELSGGEQQRVAIGSVLTLKPKLLVLDEPTANLDPKNANDILQLLIDLHANKNITIVLVEHRIDVITKYCNRVLVLDQGNIVIDDTPSVAFQNPLIEKLGVSIPRITRLFSMLEEEDYHIPQLPLDVEDALKIIFGGGKL